MANLTVERPAPGVALVTLNRPDRLNALTLELVDAVSDTFHRLAVDAELRVVVLTGAGRGFCAGMDMNAGAERDAKPGGPAHRLQNQERFSSMVRAIRDMPQPVIAAVNGPAAGAGMGLALACDVRIASPTAMFHVAAVKIGLSGGECGISYHLPRHVGSSRAFEIMLTGRAIDAAEADRIGLVSRVAGDGDVVPVAMETATSIAANSPFGVRMTKQVMWANLDVSFETSLALENRTQIMATMTDDAVEARRAFVEKRSPRFTGT